MMSGDQLQLPAGFRFHPTDEELVVHYLVRKCASQSISVPIIAEVDLYKYDPWQLPGMALYGEKEWYFFSPRDRKYPNGSRPNRAAGSGYWKATGADKPIGRPKTVGIKKALVFYAGKAPRGVKTNWIMHEYRLANVDRSAGKKNNLRLDDWVLCRIYNKKGGAEKQHTFDQKSMKYPELEDQKPKIISTVQNKAVPSSLPSLPPIPAPPTTNDYLYFETSDSVPRLHTHTDSSGSEQVMSPEKEVQSEPKWNDFDFSLYMDGFANDPFASQAQFSGDLLTSSWQDMLMFSNKSFS